MLSRVADSIYWVSRYIERSENVARFVDVNQTITLGGAAQWSPLIYASGDEEMFALLYGDTTPENVLRFLLFDKRNGNSVYSCLIKARENARTIRDILSVSLWEAINRFYLRVRESTRDADRYLKNPADFLARVKRGSYEVMGVMEATTSHGDAWDFAWIGRLLERADKTSRILDVKYYVLLPNVAAVGSALDIVQWSALLESTSALHMYRKQYGRIDPQSVAEFLVLDPQFPRSIHFCVAQAEKIFHNISGANDTPARERIVQEFAALRSRLESTSIRQILDYGLHEFIDNCQQGLNEIGTAMHHAFFVIRQPEAVAEPPGQSQTQS